MQPSDLDEYDANLSTVPISQFLPRDQLHADWTNRWVPNVECLKATVEDSLFDVVHCDTWGDRALLEAQISEDDVRRSWNNIDSGVRTRSPTSRRAPTHAELRSRARQ